MTIVERNIIFKFLPFITFYIILDILTWKNDFPDKALSC